MKKIRFFYRELLNTFWFIPVLIVGISIVLSIALVSLDNYLSIPKDNWFSFFLVNSSDSARSILSTISGAMIGVAGTVFSVTLVALTLASSQFGPRLIKNFMYVRLNQIVLGAYIATYLYCLLVLNAIKGNGENTFVPSISILLAIIAAIANIILLITFIHRIAISIQADRVIADIADFISNQVTQLFPEKMGEGEYAHKEIDIEKATSVLKDVSNIKARKSGYIQYIDSEGLMELVTGNESFLHLHHRPGSYLVEGMVMATVYTNAAWKDELLDKFHNQFVIGKTKTSQQDLEFSIHQMVEIAARALSPGVNDPYTAIACIDNLTATMAYLAQVKFPSTYRYDAEGKLRIVADVLNFEGVLDASFNQIRQFSGGSAAVIIRLMECLTIIHSLTLKAEYKKAVCKHAGMVLNIGKQTIKEENDLNDLAERANKIFKSAIP